MRQRACPLNAQHSTAPNQAGQASVLGILLRLDDAPCDAGHRTRLDFGSGERTRAADLPAPVYGWYTEGFDTLDLKQAEALLHA